MALITPKTDWKSGDVPTATDFNRIEGNIADIAKLTDNVAVESAISAIFFKIGHPVGSILETLSSRNPATYYQDASSTSSSSTTGVCGTWEAYAQGRVLVGNGTSDQKFNAGDSAGSSSVTLAEEQMPTHSHSTPSHTHSTPGHSHNHSHTVSIVVRNGGSTTMNNDYGCYGYSIGTTTGGSPSMTTSSNFVHSGGYNTGVRQADGDGKTSESGFFNGGGTTGGSGGTSGNTGSGFSHNNLQPYQVIYIWRRTA